MDTSFNSAHLDIEIHPVTHSLKLHEHEQTNRSTSFLPSFSLERDPGIESIECPTLSLFPFSLCLFNLDFQYPVSNFQFSTDEHEDEQSEQETPYD